MKFSCGFTREGHLAYLRDQAKELRRWKKMFAWTPVHVGQENGKYICVWLTSVWCRYPYAEAGRKRDGFFDSYTGEFYLDKGDPEFRVSKDIPNE